MSTVISGSLRNRRFTLRRLSSLFAVFALLSLLGACTYFGERGSGRMTTETRDVSGFTEVDLGGSGRVVIEVTGEESLTVEAEDNIIPLLRIEVRNGRLILGSRGNISPTREIVYTITAASLEAVEVSGSGSISASGIDEGAFEVEISGSGSVVVEGSADSLDLSISGSGAFDGEELQSASGDVSVSGSGSALVNVSDELDVGVSGSGSVVYLGDPTVSVSISGSGNVSRR